MQGNVNAAAMRRYEEFSNADGCNARLVVECNDRPATHIPCCSTRPRTTFDAVYSNCPTARAAQIRVSFSHRMLNFCLMTETAMDDDNQNHLEREGR
jgi:hypothetical protein